VSAIERWWSEGEHLLLDVGGAKRSIFTRRLGEGPSMTLLHGFPSSSYDWAKVAPGIASGNGLLLLDFLGFGASEKPAEHEYSIAEQADIVQALWAREGIASTTLVAHDYGVSVAQELLAREREGALGVELRAVHFLNGGVYPDLHRAQPAQLALLDPEQGPQLSALLSEELFVQSLRPSFAESYDAAADSADIWSSTHRGEGERIMHLLIRYISDRRANEGRWVGALESTRVPLAFTWGMLDPISGAHIAQRIAERLPSAPLLVLEDVAHWPPLEAPRVVERAILANQA
jgi:pimeloyl-ACP methyl ester carboxylesterase